MYSSLENIIPAPSKCEATAGTLPVNKIHSYSIGTGVPSELCSEIEEISQHLMLQWQHASSGDFCLEKKENLTSEAWIMDICPSRVMIQAGGRPGFCYALEAFLQMLLTATSNGPKNAVLTCGHIEDAPRFPWRGLLLDSARHFQRPEVIKNVLRMMRRFRLNKLHWHLIDSQGFRIPSKRFPLMQEYGTCCKGCYTAKELKEIENLAQSLDIDIIPELDAPGHFNGFLTVYPEFACDPKNIGEECCIGNPRTLEMVKEIYREAMELLPCSKYIHVGGDEAETKHWDACPRCQQAVKDAGFTGSRQLEHHFMAQLKNYVRQLGRQPLSWSIPANNTQAFPMEFSKEDIIQTWLDLREPIFWAQKGNKVIYSLHTSLYLDYPRNFSETHEGWMFSVTDQSIYLCEPFGIWPESVKDAILGTEACLWTETIPEWRVLPKLLPRMPAYAECAWSAPARKDWYDFARRKEILEGAGYFDLIRQLL